MWAVVVIYGGIPNAIMAAYTLKQPILLHEHVDVFQYYDLMSNSAITTQTIVIAMHIMRMLDTTNNGLLDISKKKLVSR
jgi:hypothetical protein